MYPLLGRIAAIAAAVPLALGGVTTPGHAKPSATTLTTSLGPVTLAPGGPSRTGILWATPSGPVPDDPLIHFSVDWSGIADVADLEMEAAGMIDIIVVPLADPDDDHEVRTDGCQARAQTLTCTTRHFSLSGPFPLALLNITPKPGVPTGAAGDLRITSAVNGGPEKTNDFPVRIGEGVDLQAFDTPPIDVSPGESAPLDTRIRNSGDTTVGGVVLHLDVNPSLTTGPRHRNCLYGTGMTCTFIGDLAPGATYRLADPITLRPPADAASGSRLDGTLSWQTVTEWEEVLKSFPAGALTDGTTPGTGPELELTEVVTAAGVPQAEVDSTDNSGRVTLTVKGGKAANLRAVGTRVTAPVGKTATVRVSRVNTGPATLHPTLFAGNQLPVEITLPSNTEVAGLDHDCFTTDEQQVQCLPYDQLRAGGRQDFTLQLTVLKAGGKPGRISTPALPGSDVGTARIVVTGTDDKPELPITGPGPFLATLGLMLVAAGATTRRLAG